MVTLFQVFHTLSKQGDWLSFAKRGDPAPVCMEVAKSGLKLWKEKYFLIDRRAIPVHMPWRHPDSCITYKVPTSFNQNHVDRLKDHIMKLRDIQEGVLVQSGLSRVWRNPMCDLVLRRSNNTGKGIYDFLCMPSLDKATVREEPHEIDTSILGRVADRTTSPAPAGTAIPHASPKEIAITRPDPKKVSGACSSGLVAGDGVEQTDDGTLDDDGQCDESGFAMEDIGNLNDVSQGEHINVIPFRTFDPSLGLDVTYPPILLPDKEVEAHAELSGGVRRATRASFHASHGKLVSSFTLSSNYTSNTVGDVLKRDLLPFVPGPYYIPYPYDEGFRSESLPYTRDDWEEIHGVNLGLQRKELYKDPKVCRTVLDRFSTPAETHRLRELSSVELFDQISVLQCQLITHGSMLNAHYDHSLRNVERLTKRCAQQTQIIKKQGVNLKQQKESTIRANEEVSRLTAEPRVLKGVRRLNISLVVRTRNIGSIEIRGTLFPLRKQRLRKSLLGLNFTSLVRRFLKSGKFNRAFAGVLNTAISVGVERGLRMDRTDEEFRGIS
ncbi:hypothetical protein Tco_1203809 [Tanacetum coccineum]